MAKASKPNHLTHGRAIASANHLHSLGHISESKRDRIVKGSQKAIAAMTQPMPKSMPKGSKGPIKKADKPYKNGV